MARLSSLLLVMLLFTSCSTITPVEKRRTQFEDCILKMSGSDIPALKALKICQSVYRTPKDIKTEEQLERE